MVDVSDTVSGLPVRAGEVFGGDLPGTDVLLLLYVQRGLLWMVTRMDAG